MRVGTIVAYAARSAVVHGHWARMTEQRRPLILAAEKWLWNMLERELELRLIGHRLDAPGGQRYSVTHF
jgi:hypothetical protein